MSTLRLEIKARFDLNRLRGGETVTGEDPELLKEALRRHPAAVDPTHCRQFYRQEGLVKLAKDAGVPFVLSLLPILHSTGNARAKIVHQYRRFIALCMHDGAQFKLSLDSENEYDQKSLREMEAVATTLFGLTSLQARRCLSVRG